MRQLAAMEGPPSLVLACHYPTKLRTQRRAMCSALRQHPSPKSIQQLRLRVGKRDQETSSAKGMWASSQGLGSGVGAVLAAEADSGLETRGKAHGWEALGRGQEAMAPVKATVPARRRGAIK
jgi:hypothetical protein